MMQKLAPGGECWLDGQVVENRDNRALPPFFPFSWSFSLFMSCSICLPLYTIGLMFAS
jgi:hypothetical protein